MALVEQTSGTQTATITTEHTLATQTDGKTYVLGVDLGALANGDIVELCCKTKMLSGGTSRIAYKATFAHAVSEPNIYSVPIPAVHEVVFTLKQTAGTGRAFPWSVISLD